MLDAYKRVPALDWRLKFSEAEYRRCSQCRVTRLDVFKREVSMVVAGGHKVRVFIRIVQVDLRLRNKGAGLVQRRAANAAECGLRMNWRDRKKQENNCDEWSEK
jgi:hypothetical protein